MIMKPLVVSFFTNDWEYPKYAKMLADDCLRLGLECHIVEKPSTNSYVGNCNIKPFFIKESLERFARPVLWMDVDGTLNKLPPQLLTEALNYDLAGNRSRSNPSRIHVGSLWFNFTSTTIELLDAWCHHTVGFIDDGALQNAVHDTTVRFLELPAECHAIAPTRTNRPVPLDSYFVHRLASSTLKIKYKNSNR